MTTQAISSRTRLTYDKMDSNAALYGAVAHAIALRANAEVGRLFFACDTLEAAVLHWMETADYESRPTIPQLTARFISDVTTPRTEEAHDAAQPA